MGARAESNNNGATAYSPGDSGKSLASLRYALLSVYYGSLGRELSITGAPAMLMPLDVRPMSLDDALVAIKDNWPGYLRDAIWRVVRSVTPPQRYPDALEHVLAGHDPPLSLAELSDRIAGYHPGASLLGDALIASVEQSDEAPTLRDRLQAQARELSDDAALMLGTSLYDYLGSLDPGQADRLKKLDTKLHLDLTGYSDEFTKALAFLKWWKDDANLKMGPHCAAQMKVFPVTTVLHQDVSTLTTEITVTALVQCGDFDTLRRSVDPQCWACSSDVVTRTRYVDSSWDLHPVAPTAPGTPPHPGEPARLLEEQVNVAWGLDRSNVGSFHNVLRIDEYTENPHVPSLSVRFSLARSIDSQILWDQRGGGILVDQGFITVRPVHGDRWQITSRKTILFSDRAPNAGGPGFLDFGQMLNYLTPAALTWWLESELYSAADEIYSDPDKVKQCLAKQRNGSD